LQHLLRFGLVFPEIGRGGARLEAGQFFFRAGGFKDSSADPQRVCSDPRSGASSRRQSAFASPGISHTAHHEATKGTEEHEES
jgi:hypothetical protein